MPIQQAIAGPASHTVIQHARSSCLIPSSSSRTMVGESSSGSAKFLVCCIAPNCLQTRPTRRPHLAHEAEMAWPNEPYPGTQCLRSGHSKSVLSIVDWSRFPFHYMADVQERRHLLLLQFITVRSSSFPNGYPQVLVNSSNVTGYLSATRCRR
jgi:hypothetical protein